MTTLLICVASLALAPPASAQIPQALEDRFLLTLGGQDAGSESYRVERLADGYRLSCETELSVGAMKIVQRVSVRTDEWLAFQWAQVAAEVNGRATNVDLQREEGRGRQQVIQGADTTVQSLATPESSVLLTNNVIHHMAQFTWLHPGGVGAKVSFTAFPNVPVTVSLEAEGTARRDEESLSWRRYYLNLANRVGAYVWLSEEGVPLKVSVPLQSFTAVSQAHRSWADLLTERGNSVDAGENDEWSAYDSEDVGFHSDTVRLAGTLSLPRAEAPHPAVVLISGSGPQDRDENTPGPGGLKLGIFRSIADTLTRRGIAVLRYDDRGVGESEGDFTSAGLGDLVADVEAAVRFLRSRPDIDEERIALVGHSEGAIIAPIVAAADERVNAIVLMAGTATPLDSVLVEQMVGAALSAGGDSAAVAAARANAERLVRAIRQGREPEGEMAAILEVVDAQRRWLLEHFEHDPLATLRGVGASVLIVNGGQDVQVAPAHAERLAAALAEVGHPDFELRLFPQLNHLFAVSRAEGTAEYADPNARVDAVFLGYLAGWLSERLLRD